MASCTQDACQGSEELALSVLRVGFACPALRTLPLGASLLEGLLGMLLQQHGRPPPAEPRAAAGAKAAAKLGGRSSLREEGFIATQILYFHG